MIFFENVLLAFASLKANKMRSLLTMLGIIIGISSVIAIMTMGDSLSNSLTSSMESMGGNNISVMLNYKEAEEEVSENGAVFGKENNSEYGLEESDLMTREMIEGLVSEYPDEIKAISVTKNLGNGMVGDSKLYANVTVNGVNIGYFFSNNLKLKAGKFFSAEDLEEGRNVALVSDYFVNNLYEGDCEAALGQSVTVELADDFKNYTIIGVYEYAAQAGMGMVTAYDTMTSMYIPYKTACEDDTYEGYTNFDIVTNPGIDSDRFCAKIERYFEAYYRNNKYFEVITFNMSSIISVFSDLMGTITTAIAVIAGIALLVGGIGVMNIMLVSITERTREIGTRKALGATNSSIRQQFITEAIVICLVGGIIGIILGVALGMVAANALGYPATPSITSIVVSLGFSMAIGVFFGYYPANKAAKMDPIEALRYE